MCSDSISRYNPRELSLLYLVNDPGWLGRDFRMELDTIAVDVARGEGVDFSSRYDLGVLVYISLLSLTFSFPGVRIFDCSEVSRSLPLDDVLLRNLLPIQLEIFDHHDVPLAISSWSGAGVDGPGWLGMGLDTIAVDVARGGAGVDGPGWLGGDSRIGLDTIAVDVARGGAGVDGPG